MEEIKLSELSPERYAAIYARRSIKKDVDELPSQVNDCLKYAKINNLIIFNTYVDFESATKYEPMHRKGFKELVYDLKNNRFKTLIVFKRDRLARDILHFKEIKALCKEYNVKMAYAAEGEIQPSDNYNYNFMETLQVANAALEPQFGKIRAKAGIDQMIKDRRYWGKPIFGYYKIGNGRNSSYKPQKEYISIIKLLFVDFKDIGQRLEGLEELCAKLNSFAFKNKLDVKNGFTPDKVKSIVKNPQYGGYRFLEPNNKLEKYLIFDENLKRVSVTEESFVPYSNVTSVIEFNLWKACIERLCNSSEKYRNVVSEKESYLFKGMLFCARCKKAIVLNESGYRCVKNCITFDEHLLLYEVLRSITSEIINNDAIKKYQKNNINIIISEINQKCAQIKTLNGKLDRVIMKMIMEKECDDNIIKEYYDKIELFKKQCSALKQKKAFYDYIDESIYKLVNNENKGMIVEHLVLHKDTTQDFLKSIIEKVVIDSRDEEFRCETVYTVLGHMPTLFFTIRQKFALLSLYLLCSNLSLKIHT